MNILRFTFLFTTFFLLVLSAAAPLPDQRELNEFLHGHTQDLDKRIKENMTRPFKPLMEFKETEIPEITDKGRGEQCVTIHTIIFTGESHLTKKAKRLLTAPFLDQCLSPKDIENLLHTITLHYHNRGYITSKANLKLPQLATKDGILEITVSEGWIEDIVFNDNSFLDRLQRDMAFPFLKGESLNIKDIDQGIEQIKRLPSQNVTMSIEPGKNKNGSLLYVKTVERQIFKPVLSYRNDGEKYAKPVTWSLSASAENLLALNDKISGSMSQKDGDNDEIYDRSSMLSFTVPFGYTLFDITHSESKYRSVIKGSNTTFVSHGFVYTDNFTLNYVLFRDQAQKLLLEGDIQHRKNKSFINQTLVEVSSHNVTSAEMGISYQKNIPAGSITFDLKYRKGMDWFDADDNPDGIKNYEANKRFVLYKTHFDISKYLYNWLQASVNIDAQQAYHELLSNEQFYSVKQLSEDSGRSVKMAFTLFPSQLIPSMANEWTQGLMFTTDYAYATSYSFYDKAQDQASLYTSSLIYSLAKLTVSMTTEYGGINPGWMESDKAYNNFIFSVQLKEYLF